MEAQTTTFRINYEGGAAPPVVLRRERVLIGSDEADCAVLLDKLSTVSPRHAALRWREGRFYITDIDEANATLLNRRLLMYDDEAAITGGDTVEIGPYLFEFDWEPGRPELSVKVTRLILPSVFLIKRTDLPGEKVIEREGLSIGSDKECHLWLNHLNVSPLHAGVNRIRDCFDPSRSDFYLTDLTTSNSTLLDDRLLITHVPARVSDGSRARLGPYLLTFGVRGATLEVEVELTPTSNTGTPEERPVTESPAAETQTTAGASSTRAQVEAAGAEQTAQAGREEAGRAAMTDVLKIFWAKRTRAKAARTTPLHPRPFERPGRARFAWRSTTDLARPRSLAVAFWVLLAAGLTVWFAARSDSLAFEPRPLSLAHARTDTGGTRRVASKPAANACATCHATAAGMNESCASCHRTEAFVAAVTDGHRAAGIGCTHCHAEHRGADFRPGLQPLGADIQRDVGPQETCVGCHDDNNKRLYAGKPVRTPHGGSFGYPLVNGRWAWPGLTQKEWETKPPEVRAQLARMTVSATIWPVAGGSVERRRSVEFHTLHVYRLGAAAGLKGGRNERLECASCHTSIVPIDRDTPRTTCAACHNGCTDARTGRTLIASDRPNCTSCHVQHVREAPAADVPCGPASVLSGVAAPRSL